MADRLVGHLSLCVKARKLELGFDAVKEALMQHRITHIFLSAQLSPKSEKEIRFLAGDIPVRETPYSFDDIWFIVGKRTGIIGVTDAALGALALADLDEATATREENS